MRRVLFVDDDRDVLDGLRRMLHGQRRQWEMSFVGSGEAALAALAAAPHDVVVADLRMPTMDGKTLLTEVRARFSGVVRIILSGHTELEAALRMVPVSHVFLTKPCEAARLVETIDRACSLQELLDDDALKRHVSAMSSIPTLPRVYTAVGAALADPDVPLRHVAQTIEQDIGLCAKVLRLLNSGFFGLPRRVSSIETAIRLLGTNMLKNIVLSVEVFDASERIAGVDGLSIAALQRHSLLAAGIARRLLPERLRAEDAFMAAMLHDVGTLVLAMERPRELGRLLALGARTGRPLHVLERDAGAASHARVGAYVLGLWSLPYPIVEAVAHHDEPARVAATTFDVLGAVHVANALAHEHASPGAAGHLDEAYLEKIGVAGKLDAWRALAAEQAAA
jgi:HD-like signal output (HDOD) protein